MSNFSPIRSTKICVHWSEIGWSGFGLSTAILIWFPRTIKTLHFQSKEWKLICLKLKTKFPKPQNDYLFVKRINLILLNVNQIKLKLFHFLSLNHKLKKTKNKVLNIQQTKLSLFELKSVKQIAVRWYEIKNPTVNKIFKPCKKTIKTKSP